MSIDIEKLEVIARKASEGPWALREMVEDCFVEAPGSTEMPYRLDVCGDDYTGHGDDEQRRHNMEYIAATDPTTVLALIERVRQFEAQLEDARLQAQSHAQEARTQRATVQEIYQLVSGGQGEPGDWNGAEPVREALAAERERGDALATRLEQLKSAAKRAHGRMACASLTLIRDGEAAYFALGDALKQDSEALPLARRLADERKP